MKRTWRFCWAIGLMLLILSGCMDKESRFTPAESPGDEFYTEQHAVFNSFDVCELKEQVDGYWNYYEENEKQKALRAQRLSAWRPNYLKPGKYTAGKDILAGLYICKSLKVLAYAIVTDRQGNASYYWFSTESYVFLNAGDILKVNSDIRVALAENAPDLSAEKDGIYYEGSYRVGEDIPEGEYFMLSTDLESGRGQIAKNSTYQLDDTILRFGYTKIAQGHVVNLKNSVLIPLDKKPFVESIVYQGDGEGTAQRVFAQGGYEIGTDIPIGTYQIKNELFRSVTDLSYKGYHGNEIYSPVWANRAGIYIPDLEDQQHFGWKWLELDYYIHDQTRYLKKHSACEGKPNTFIKTKGLPTVTFTEDDIGRKIQIVNCILI